MTTIFRLGFAATALASAALAQQTFPVARVQPSAAPPGPVRDATSRITRIVNPRTGQALRPDGGALRGACTVVFDSLSAPPQDPNLELNLSYTDPNGGVLCDYPVSPQADSFIFAGTSNAGCAQFPGPSNASFGPTDIIFEPLRMEAVALDQPHMICQVDGVFYTLNSDPGAALRFFLGAAEWADSDGSGAFDVTGGIEVTIEFEPDDPPGLYTFSVVLPPELQFPMYGEGVFYHDVAGVNGHGNPTCGVAMPLAGGTRSELGSCESAEDLLTAGSLYTGDPNDQSDIWVWHSSDPNCAGPAPCTDPNQVDYGAIWDSPNGVFWVFSSASSGVDLAASYPLRLFAAASEPACPDCDGDGTINIVDLGLLLSGFNQAPGGCDVDGDGATNIADLGSVLANFNTGCP